MSASAADVSYAQLFALTGSWVAVRPGITNPEGAHFIGARCWIAPGQQISRPSRLKVQKALVAGRIVVEVDGQVYQIEISAKGQVLRRFAMAAGGEWVSEIELRRVNPAVGEARRIARSSVRQ